MRVIKEKKEEDDETPQRFWLFGPSFVQSPAKIKEEEEENAMVGTSEEKSPLLSSTKKRRRSASKKAEPLKKIRVENSENCLSSIKITKSKPVNSKTKKKDKNAETSKGESAKRGLLVTVKSEKSEDDKQHCDGSTGHWALSIVKMERDEKVKAESNGVVKVGSGKRGVVSKKRWTKERYSRAEEVVMDLMRRSGEPRLARRELREMARKHIGDTGLLDHLLKHMAGTVVGDRGERFMRGYNEDGVMFYWLESESNNGGGSGTGICRCCDRCAEEIKTLKEGVATLNWELKELQTLKESEESAWKAKYDRLLDTNIDLELKLAAMKSSVQELKNKYENLQEKNIKLEAKMAGIGISSQGLKGEMLEEKKNIEDEMAEEMEVVGDAKRDSDSEGGVEKNAVKQLNEHPNAFGSSQMRRPHLILTLRGQVMC